MRNRQKPRDLKQKRREERLDRRNVEGYLDLTAFKAVANIREKDKLQDKSSNVSPFK